MRRTIRILAILAILLPLGNRLPARSRDEAVADSGKEALVKALCEKIEAVCAFPEAAAKACARLRENLKLGRYGELASARDLARRLDADIQAATGDKHFGVAYDPEQAAEMAAQAGETYTFYTPRLVEEYRRQNYGFRAVKVLEGNVGYLDLVDFFPLRWAGAPAVAAMSFLADCDAIIVDLRGNGGGEDQTVTFLLSYFLDTRSGPIAFSTSFTPAANAYYQSATWPYVPGRPLSDKPLYVLTSRSSFSGAEAFAFHLQTLKRATLVGERTRGGAHPVEIVAVAGSYVAYIPSTRTVSSLAASDWEGVGVKPDLEVPAAEALAAAHELALARLAGQTADESLRFYREWALAGVRSGRHPIGVAPERLRAYAGFYGDLAIRYEAGGLFYQRGDRARLRLVPMDQTLFRVEGQERIRLRFPGAADGTPRLEMLFDDGRVVSIPRTGPAK